MVEFLFSVVKWFGIGLVALVVITLIFGKRIKKKWEYEAEFRDDSFKEFGEFEVEMSKIEKEEPDFTLKYEFHLRHDAVRQHQPVQVFIDELLVLEGLPEKDGYVRLGNDHVQNSVDEPLLDKTCRVLIGGQEIVSQTLKRD